MPRSTNWFMRKYVVENNKPKQICQIYKIELYENKNNNNHQQCQLQDNSINNINNSSKSNLPSSQPIRVSKHYVNPHIPIWAQFNQSQQFGYQVQPQSPISCFNDNQHYFDHDYTFYESQKQKYSDDYSWEQSNDPHGQWVSY